MTYQKALPVVVSICIILAVAYLRNRSRTLAVILGTMPINLPLALWVTFGGSGASQEEIVAFVRSLLWGLAATGVWLVVLYLVVRSGGSLALGIGVGYFAWAALIVGLIVTGVLSVTPR